MTSRDPGRIASAFNRLGDHMEENRRRREYALNNPDSQAAMELAASGGVFGGRTSQRSPSRVSGAQRAQLTGVRENLDAQGWSEPATALPHLCFPPDTYPQAVGPGSQWRCRCGAVWVSAGIMWAEYPQTSTRTEAALGPERWHYVSGGQLNEESYLAQEELYDWRPLGTYYVKLMRAMIDNQLAAMGEGPRGESTAPTDWRDIP